MLTFINLQKVPITSEGGRPYTLPKGFPAKMRLPSDY